MQIYQKKLTLGLKNEADNCYKCLRFTIVICQDYNLETCIIFVILKKQQIQLKY